jgi:crotonobetainyl-CoA:carnitine CoA-transferase CaiB-like acyl-CoA transferase
VKNRETLHQVAEERISTMPVEHWTELFAEVRVPSGKINPIDEAFEFAERLGLSPTYTHLLSGIEAVPQVSNPITLSETPPTYRQPPPGLGEHDDDVRQWLNTPRERDDATKT